MCVCVCVSGCLYVFLYVFCEGSYEKEKCVRVWAHEERDYHAAISNSFCFVIQERFGTLEGGSVHTHTHTNAEDTQTGLIDGEYEL